LLPCALLARRHFERAADVSILAIGMDWPKIASPPDCVRGTAPRGPVKKGGDNTLFVLERALGGVTGR
jgi:hypothetical protein